MEPVKLFGSQCIDNLLPAAEDRAGATGGC